MKNNLFKIASLIIIGILVSACIPINPTPTATPEPFPTDPSNLTVTLADQGKTITLHVGEGFLLDLGETYDWNIQIADQTIISRVPNIMVIRGAQGIYDAHAVGTTTLSATGNPVCYSSNPPCLMPSILFEITIVVSQ